MTYSFERNNVRRSGIVKPSIYGGGGTVGLGMPEIGTKWAGQYILRTLSSLAVTTSSLR